MKNKQVRTIKRRKRWSVFEKLKIVEESKHSLDTICSVAEKYNISPSMLYLWRRLERDGKLKAFNQGEEIVPASAIKRLQFYVDNLELLLEKKSKEIEFLKAAISEKLKVDDLENYPVLRMAIKYNLIGDINNTYSREQSVSK